MALQADYEIEAGDDATLALYLSGAAFSSGYATQFSLLACFGASGPMYAAYGGYLNGSNYWGQSGLTLPASGQVNAFIPSAVTSGLDPQALAYCLERTDPGFRDVLLEGFVVLLPQLGA
jgi:hypothetical protein